MVLNNFKKMFLDQYIQRRKILKNCMVPVCSTLFFSFFFFGEVVTKIFHSVN